MILRLSWVILSERSIDGSMGRMIVLALALALGQTPSTKTWVASDLYGNCKDGLTEPQTSERYFQLGQCGGYIDGLLDGIDQESFGICLNNYTIGTLIKVYVAYMDRNQKYLDRARSFALIFALHDAYPCPAKPAKK